MSKHYRQSLLHALRNQIPVDTVITDMLHLELRHSHTQLRFPCPLCYNFHTATNPKTNLARCFDCQKNFNPIDMVIAVGNCSFVDAVEFLMAKSKWPV